MPVLKKLMQARILLAAQPLKKSGKNPFAGYRYFELSDFLPQTMQIFYDLELASMVNFTQETATLTITDCEDGSTVCVSSPMAESSQKGNQPIQNLGAVQSYQRRYLWMAALELVENDAIDSTNNPGASSEEEEESKPAPKPAVKPAPKPAPPKYIVGKDGEWQVRLSVSSDSDDWAGTAEQALSTALEMTQNLNDLLTLFKKNKQLFEELKSQAPELHQSLLAKFSQARRNFESNQPKAQS